MKRRPPGPQAFLRRLFVAPIHVYQAIFSPLLPPACIYSPTCSQYAREAILRHGVLLGLMASLARIARCAGGLFEGGEDPVPARITLSALARGYRRFRLVRGRRKRRPGRRRPLYLA